MSLQLYTHHCLSSIFLHLAVSLEAVGGGSGLDGGRDSCLGEELLVGVCRPEVVCESGLSGLELPGMRIVIRSGQHGDGGGPLQ